MKDEIIIKPNYPFWRHPIRWWGERKQRQIMQIFVNQMWRNGIQEEVEKMNMDLFLYGQSVMKGGKRVDPKSFTPNS